MGAKGLCVDGSKVDDSLELLGQGSKFSGEGSTFFWGFGEDVGERNTRLDDGQMS